MLPTRALALLATLAMAQLAPRPALTESLQPVRRLIQVSQGKLRAAVDRAGGLLEVHRNQHVRLLLDGSGALLYSRRDGGSAQPRKVRWWGRFQRKNLPELSVGQLASRVSQLLAGGQRPRPTVSRAQLPRAILPDGKEVPPDSMLGGYHGTSLLHPRVALTRGLPARGKDRRLKEHSESQSCSAFRGCTQVVSDPVTGNGAAYWAGAGGWVYEIRGVPGWDVNAQLNGRVKTLAGYRGNLMVGEQEIAIPARVPAERIKAYGQVEQDHAGRLLVRTWIRNPGYREAKPADSAYKP